MDQRMLRWRLKGLGMQAYTLGHKKGNKCTTLRGTQRVKEVGAWQVYMLWNVMVDDAKSCTCHKWNILGGSKLETRVGTYTIAMQCMKHMANTTQNSPRACQNDAKTCMEGSQNKLAWRARSMVNARQIRWITLHLLRPSMEWLNQQKSE